MKEDKETDINVLGCLLGFWFIIAFCFMSNATYHAAVDLFNPETSWFTAPIFWLICAGACLTPVGWIISLHWMATEWEWSIFEVFMVYGVFVFIFFIYIFGIVIEIFEGIVDMVFRRKKNED